MTPLFVYGTLRKGQPNHKVLDMALKRGDARFVGMAHLRRCAMYDTDHGFPFVDDRGLADEFVVGELYDVTDRVLLPVVGMELRADYNAEWREVFDAETGTSRGEAVTFIVGQTHHTFSGPRLIPGGDWVEHTSNRRENAHAG